MTNCPYDYPSEIHFILVQSYGDFMSRHCISLPCHLPDHNEFVISTSSKIFTTTGPAYTVNTS